jgi:hypothetical protein
MLITFVPYLILEPGLREGTGVLLVETEVGLDEK